MTLTSKDVKSQIYYTPSQTSPTEMMRIYRYFEGWSRGGGVWIKKLKDLFPDACYEKDYKICWDFDPDKIWKIILQNNKWRRKLEFMRIDSYWELSARITPTTTTHDKHHKYKCANCRTVFLVHEYRKRCPNCYLLSGEY